MKIEDKDIDILDFARKISMLSIHTPISKRFDHEYGQKNNRWWLSQREHLTVWCLHQPTNGIKNFKHKPNFSAKTMYNRFGRPETLLWLAEAIGIDYNVINELLEEIVKLNNKEACKRIRERIPFDLIYELVIELEL